MTTTHQAYRFALDPTPTQARDLARHCGAARVAFNWALARVKAVLGQRAAEATYGIEEVELTSNLSWSSPALRRAWNAAKSDVAPWWAECSKESYNTGLDNLARALNNWAHSREGRSKGRKVGFPRFKAKRRASVSCRFTTGTIRVDPGRHHVTLPRLGSIKTHESTRKLARRMLHIRVFRCEGCGLVLDRDLNAARNLAALVRHVDPQWAGDAKQARGADRTTTPWVAGGVETRTQPRQQVDQTGTAEPQGSTA